MTREDFEKAVGAFDACELYICVADLDDSCGIATRGCVDDIIPTAINIITERAKQTDDAKLEVARLMTASAVLDGIARQVMCDKEVPQEGIEKVFMELEKILSKEKAPGAAGTALSAEGKDVAR